MLLGRQALVMRDLSGSQSIARGIPPTVLRPRPDGGGKENGIRMISRYEGQATVDTWLRSMGLISGATKFAQYDMISALDKFFQAMPGLKPRLNELVALGDFVDGRIECIAGLYWKKKTFPAEMDVVILVCNPRSISSTECYDKMVDFIYELCTDNAILPNFEHLAQYKSLRHLSRLWRNQIQTMETPMNHSSHLTATVDLRTEDAVAEEVRSLYLSCNKAPLICLDELTPVNLGIYWYEMTITHPLDPTVKVQVYFRKKQRRDHEYELLFHRPQTGTQTGSATACGSLIINIDNISSYVALPVKDVAAANALLIASAISRKITHPSVAPFTHIE